MRIGIMGGTFDPIHNGHLMLGEAALSQFSLDEVWFMPNGNPPHKSRGSIQSDAHVRAHMTGLAIEGKEKFRLELYEVERENVSYSYETLEHFRNSRREDQLYFIIGADSLLAIETWASPGRVLKACTILAAYRDDMDTPEEMNAQIHYLNEKYGGDIRLLRVPLMDVSSRKLRGAIRKGQDISAYVPAKVAAYIRKEGLYGRKDQQDKP